MQASNHPHHQHLQQQQQLSNNISPMSSGSHPNADINTNQQHQLHQQHRHQRKSRSRMPLFKHMLELEAQGLHLSSSRLDDTAASILSDRSDASVLNHSHTDIVAPSSANGLMMPEEEEGGVIVPSHWDIVPHETTPHHHHQQQHLPTPPVSPTNSDFRSTMNEVGMPSFQSPPTLSIVPNFFSHTSMMPPFTLLEGTSKPKNTDGECSGSSRQTVRRNTSSTTNSSATAAPSSPLHFPQRSHYDSKTSGGVATATNEILYSTGSDTYNHRTDIQDDSEDDDFPSIPSPV